MQQYFYPLVSKKINTLILFIFFALLSNAQTPILSPGMTITCLNSCNSPVGEEVENVIDGTLAKFLDFNILNTGFTVNTASSSVANRIEFTTANDAPERDPINYTLEGSNDGIAWTSITSGTIPCIASRDLARSFSFSNAVSYSWYRVTFPDVCDNGIANSMQIAEVQLYSDNTLPIHLLSFTSLLNSNNVLLKWELAQPEDDGVYELQRSSNGRNFNTINTQIGDQVKTLFSYSDNYLPGINIYYRLKMSDNAGKITYSNIAFIKGHGSKEISISIYPSPVVKGSNFQISISNATLEGWQLINSSGVILAQKNSIKITGSTTIQLPGAITNGIYYLRIQTDKGIKNQKIIIQ
jgi:hypothetical protein